MPTNSTREESAVAIVFDEEIHIALGRRFIARGRSEQIEPGRTERALTASACRPQSCDCIPPFHNSIVYPFLGHGQLVATFCPYSAARRPPFPFRASTGLRYSPV